jgi:putative phosphoribosyl transferase
MKLTEPNEVSVKVPGAVLQGELSIPESAHGLVVFAQGSGSDKQCPRNRRVARSLRQAGLGTLLLELMTPQEERLDAHTRHLRFDAPLLARRLQGALEWLAQHPETSALPVGLFGASTGAAVALLAAAERPDLVWAVVSKGGRPELAGPRLARVRAPTLLVVGALDQGILELNQEALLTLGCLARELVTVPGATHLFEEAGTLEEVSRQAARWFRFHLWSSLQERQRARGR